MYSGRGAPSSSVGHGAGSISDLGPTSMKHLEHRLHGVGGIRARLAWGLELSMAPPAAW